MGSGYEPDTIRSAVEGSLRHIRRDVIHVYPLHHAVSHVDIEAAWDAMAGLADHGLVRFIGLSNVEREQIEPLSKRAPENAAAASVQLSPDDLAAIDAVLV